MFFGAAILMSLILGFIIFIPVTIITGVIGIIMGFYIQHHKSKLEMFIVSVLSFIACLLIFLIAGIAFFDFNFIDEVVKGASEFLNQMDSMIPASDQTEQVQKAFEQMSQSLSLISVVTPSYLMITSIFFVTIVFLVSKPFINRLSSFKFELAPIRDITLPKSLLWYYLFIMIVSLFVETEQGSFSYSVILNLMISLQFFMLIQGYSLLFFFSNAKKWPKIVPVIATLLSLFILPLTTLVRMLGILDIGFPIREKVGKK